ncbi:MAG: DeoR/GlpR family DNA-binding transcription regulator [Planctomycetaceae bacterium]
MLVDQRRNAILKTVENKGFVSIVDLVQDVGVSESTVRRDLEYLDRIGQVRRTRGGAAYVGESLAPFEERRSRALTQKEGIARAAAELVQPGEAILLDGGTTTLEVARRLAGKSLQVVTNSLPIVGLLINQPQIELIVIGGYVYPTTGVALGPMAVAALKNIHVRRLFMSAGGITENGLYNSNALLVETERTMIDAADEVVLVSDSGKLGHSALAHLCALEVVDRFVVDAGITPAWRRIFEKANVELTIVET